MLKSKLYQKKINGMELKEFIEEFGVSEIVAEIGLDRILEEYTSDEIMWNLDDDDMAEYLDDHHYDFAKYVVNDDDNDKEIIDDYSDRDLLYELCKRHSCKNFFTKEDVKEKIDNILDSIPQYVIG